MKRPSPKSKSTTKPALPSQLVQECRLREVRGGITWTWTDGGITAGDDWETRV